MFIIEQVNIQLNKSIFLVPFMFTRAWSGSEFFGFGFDFHDGFGFGFTRVWKLPFDRVYFGFGFEKIAKTRRVFGFTGSKKFLRYSSTILFYFGGQNASIDC